MIECSQDHRFPTPDGDRCARDLRSGSVLFEARAAVADRTGFTNLARDHVPSSKRASRARAKAPKALAASTTLGARARERKGLAASTTLDHAWYAVRLKCPR
jgi:hypothetical protein